MEQKAMREEEVRKPHDYEAIAESPEFKELVKRKNKFLVPVTVFFLLFYFTLPFLTSFTTVLNVPVIGDISLVWLFALAQFIMTWTLCMYYVKKANQFDEEADAVLSKHNKTEGDRL